MATVRHIDTEAGAAALCKAVAFFYLYAGWSQHAAARDRHGRQVRPLDADAEAFDLMGAIIRTAWERRVPFRVYQRAVMALEDEARAEAKKGSATPALANLCAWSDGHDRLATEAQRLCIHAWRRLRCHPGPEPVHEVAA